MKNFILIVCLSLLSISLSWPTTTHGAEDLSSHIKTKVIYEAGVFKTRGFFFEPALLEVEGKLMFLLKWGTSTKSKMRREMSDYTVGDSPIKHHFKGKMRPLSILEGRPSDTKVYFVTTGSYDPANIAIFVFTFDLKTKTFGQIKMKQQANDPLGILSAALGQKITLGQSQDRSKAWIHVAAIPESNKAYLKRSVKYDLYTGHAIIKP